jgi:N-acetylneuraminic acid mutarotase
LASDSLFTIPKLFKVSTPTAPGTVSFDVPTGLQKDTKYFVLAYSKEEGKGVTRYNIVSFNSSGSKKPVVHSVSPLIADIGDTVTVSGKYFGGRFLQLYFGKVSSHVILQNDSVLRCIVPSDIAEAAPVLGLWDDGTLENIAVNFSLNTPVISNFTSLATFRDTLTITGDHLGYLNTLNQVRIGDVVATVVSSSRRQLKVLVPDDVPHSFNDVSLTAQVQKVAMPTQFQIRPPVITSVSPSGNVNDLVTIKGTNFHPVATKNIVRSENIQAELSGGKSQLTYHIPNGPYPRRKATITLTLLDYKLTYNSDMAIKDQWIIVGSAPFNDFNTGGSFTINNSSYVVASSRTGTESQLYLWKFNPADYSWKQISIPFKVDAAQVTATATKAYLYVRYPTLGFYEYDPSANSWTKKADYPAPRRTFGTMFSIGSKAYIGLGSSSETMGMADTDNSFYEYSSTSNTWRRIADYPRLFSSTMRNRASAFIINNIAYVGCGATNTGMVDFYSYSPTNNTWSRIHDFPDMRSYASSFSFGNFGFIANGSSGGPSMECIKYDPSLDTWKVLKASIGCASCSNNGIENGYAFVNNGNVYVGGWGAVGSFHYLYQTPGEGL